MASNKQKFVIIDGNSILHRAWHAMPPLMTKKGEVVNAVYGFTSILLKTIKDFKPDYIAVAWDLPGKTFRHEAFPEYKAHREKKPQELYDQIDRIKDVLKAFNIASFEKKGFEADDLIGTLCDRNQVNNDQVDSLIVTGDLDTLQLVDKNTSVLTPKRGISDILIYDEAAVVQRYSLNPDQLIDYKALRGDPSDNIPGVPGVGDKTAAELLKEFGTLEKIYEAVEKNKPEAKKIKEKIREKLVANKDGAILSKMLVTIIRDVDLGFDLAKAKYIPADRERLIKLFQELEFTSLIAKIPELTSSVQTELLARSPSSQTPSTAAKTGKYKLIGSAAEVKTLAGAIKKEKSVSIFLVTDGRHPIEADLAGLAFSFAKGEAKFVPTSLIFGLKDILESSAIEKNGYDLKNDREMLARQKINLAPLNFDTLIGSYLLNPGSRAHLLEDQIFTEFGQETKSLEVLLKEFKAFDKIPQELIIEFGCRRADYIGQLSPKLAAGLKENKLDHLYKDIELPLIPVLAGMEEVGVKIDAKFLNKMSVKVGDRLETISKQIYKLAGEEFNISSPLQLKRILFEKLQIPTTKIKKTKTGLSTAAAELEKMRGLHPIIDLISEHRELSKLKSTYLDALPELINKETGRVHTSFNQAVTSTGRLSSSNPNLQNIPIRTDLGNEIRKAFVAEKGYKILAADYSQLELRIAAHLSGDKNMSESFRKGEDIHKRTASEIYGVKIEDVTTEMRYAAKTINFGVLYGQGPRALSQQTGMSFDEAREFIAKYFQIYKDIRRYMDETKEMAKTKGYVETLFGRRRYLPEIKSNVAVIRSSAERMATNMPVQGTEADLIKMAMINIDEQLAKLDGNSDGKSARMLMQVHDELVFEVKEALLGKVAKIVKTKMEGVYKLAVPLVAELESGDNWGELGLEPHLFE